MNRLGCLSINLLMGVLIGVGVAVPLSRAADAPPPASSPAPASTAAPKMLTLQEQNSILKLQHQVDLLNGSMKQLQIMFQDQQAQLTKINADLEKAKADAKAAHQCLECDLDDDGKLIPKPAAAPAPSTASGNQNSGASSAH